jgi:hypothetical protein
MPLLKNSGLPRFPGNLAMTKSPKLNLIGSKMSLKESIYLYRGSGVGKILIYQVKNYNFTGNLKKTKK